MGGAKKKSLKQAEKQQALQAKKQEQEKRRRKSDSKAPDRKGGETGLPSIEDKGFLGELSKMKAITPYMVASKYSVKLSAAKDVLKTLEQRGLIQQAAVNSNLKLYRFA